jgi:uncharacterized protein (TIGR02271 family)
MTTPADWLGRPVADPSGTRYGQLEDVFVGRETGKPEYGIVRVEHGGAPAKRVAVPLDQASDHGNVITLPFAPSRVMAAPEVHGEVDSIPPESGARVRAFFAAGDDQPTIPIPSASPEAETVVSEERLDVTTERRPAEIVRLRKQVITEEVTVTVQLRREELVIEREPIGRDVVLEPDPAAFQDETEAIIVLHAEEPVIGRRVVPVERVRLRRDNVVESVSITEPVRKEHAEVEHIPTEQEHQR